MYNQLKHKFDEYKGCLKASKIPKEIKVLENNCYDNKEKYQKMRNFLDKNIIIRKSKQRVKNHTHNSRTIKIDKIALSRRDDKRIQTFNYKQHLHIEYNKSILKENVKDDVNKTLDKYD